MNLTSTLSTPCTDEVKHLALKERNEQAASMWRTMGEEEKERYKEKAKLQKDPTDLSKLTEKEKDHLVKTHKNNIIKEVCLIFVIL